MKKILIGCVLMQSLFITSWLFPHSLQDLINQCPQSSEIFKKIKDLEADIEFYKKEKEKLEQTLHTEHEMRLINDETKTRKLEQQSRLRAEAEAKWLEEVKKKQPWLSTGATIGAGAIVAVAILISSLGRR